MSRASKRTFKSFIVGKYAKREASVRRTRIILVNRVLCLVLLMCDLCSRHGPFRGGPVHRVLPLLHPVRLPGSRRVLEEVPQQHHSHGAAATTRRYVSLFYAISNTEHISITYTNFLLLKTDEHHSNPYRPWT